MERDASLPQPFLQLRKQCCQGCQALQSQWNVISRNAQHKVQEGQQALHDLVQGSVRQLQALSASQGRGGIPAFAVRLRWQALQPILTILGPAHDANIVLCSPCHCMLAEQLDEIL